MELVWGAPGPAEAGKPRVRPRSLPDAVQPQRWSSAEELAACLPGMLISISSSPELVSPAAPRPLRGALRRCSDGAPPLKSVSACLPGMVAGSEWAPKPLAPPRALRGILRGCSVGTPSSRDGVDAPSPKSTPHGLRRLQLGRHGMVSLRRAVGALRGGAPSRRAPTGGQTTGRSARAQEPQRRRVFFCPISEADIHHVTPYSSYYGVDPKFFEFDRKGKMRLTDEGIVEAFRRRDEGLPPLELEMGDERMLSRSESW